MPFFAPERRPLPGTQTTHARQRRLMISALALLLIALGLVLYRDRDFWFPSVQEAEDQPLQSAPVPQETHIAESQPESKPAKKAHRRVARAPLLAPAPAVDPPPPATITRTVLPPLEVEVVAGRSHRTIQPGTNSVHVDLQPDGSSEEVSAPPIEEHDETAANITANASEQTPASDDSGSVVTHAVQPGYPLLARQMKVQGSVQLQAFISRDGDIQDLRVLSGPPILATAAREAVKQWHFKPHFQGSEAVETQAKITVNFTISTN